MVKTSRCKVVAAFLNVACLASTGHAETVPPPPGGANVPVPKPIAGKGYRLVANWDFTSTVTTKGKLYEQFYTRYIYKNGTLDSLNDEWERFRDNENHVFDREGLNLVARAPGGLKRFGIESGMLRSKWTGQYGYYECRMKAPAARGMWPAFWLNPEDLGWPPEIDVVEIVNNGRDGPKNSFHFLHTTAEKPVEVESKLDKWWAYTPGFDYSKDYHTFAVKWTPDEVTHYVDGVLVVKRKFHWVHGDGKDAGPAHVLVNLSVGGQWPGDPQAEKDFPASLRVKFIRVWQKE